MSNYPNSEDDDASLPRVDDNVTEEGGDAINALRDAVFAIEGEVGLGGSGTSGSIATRLGVSIDPAGHIRSSALTGLGLVTLPITDVQISQTAAIQESKVALDYSTASLNSKISFLAGNIDTALNYVANHGFKLEPHLVGNTYRHVLNHIDIDTNAANYFKNRNGLLRNNTNLYTLFQDVNNDLVAHEKADATSFGSADPSTVGVGTIPPTNYAHVSSGIYLDPNRFSFIPQTITDVQQFAQFIDNSNTLIVGTRIQTLYQNGISRASRSASLSDGYHGQLIVPLTSATTYLLAEGSSAPVDNIDNGDDLVEFFPAVSNNNLFDSQFSAVKAGDNIIINYGSVQSTYIIKEVKYVVNGSNKRYVVRIDGKNLFASTTATAQINHPLFTKEKYGVLATAQAQSPVSISGALPSLIVGNPRAAEVLGNGFNPDALDGSHYNLWLVIYPDGSPSDSIYSLAPIDITGNKGATPGAYTLESVVAATNQAFRTPGYNYRFIAYSYQGNFGIMMSDSIGGASFSIISGIVDSNGSYDANLSPTVYFANVVDVINNVDAIGFGLGGSNVASPPYSPSYASTATAKIPTKIFTPLSKKTYYVNGAEIERFDLEPGQVQDSFGDGYWAATIVNKQLLGTRVKVTYQVPLDLSTSNIANGKTLTVQPETGGTVVDFGRFFIESVQFNDCGCDGYVPYTTIAVFDAVHGTGVTPYASTTVGTNVRLYFTSDSVGFSIENSSDQNPVTGFKRSFEVLINEDGYTLTQERARMDSTGANRTVNGTTLYSSSLLSALHISKVSPKLQGFAYPFLNKITLQISDFNATTGLYDGYLCNYNGVNASSLGPAITGRKGQVTRFYDYTNVDYVDVMFNLNDSVATISSPQFIDIQLFPTLSLDEEIMLLSTVELNDQSLSLSQLKDARQFGNVSEEQLSTSALDYISTPTKILNENGIVRGFDLTSLPTGASPYINTFTINGGTAIVNGKIINMNAETVSIPAIQEYVSGTKINTITWFICVNDKSEFELIASTDFSTTGSTAATYNTAGVDHTRLFNVINPNTLSPTAYTVRGTYFSDLVINQKDVVVVGTITTTIASVGLNSFAITSASFADARRYVSSGYNGLDNPFVLGENGSFRNFTSLNTWLINLTSYKSAQLDANSIGKKVIVKGNINITSPITLPSYGELITFEGDSGCFTISSNVGFYIESNVCFKNIKYNYLYNPGDDPNDQFFNAYYPSNPELGAIFCQVDPNNGNQNIIFDGCYFTTAQPYHYPFIVFSMATQTSSLQNVKIVNNKFENNFAGEDKYAVIAFDGPNAAVPTKLNGARLINCLIDGNVCNKNQMIIISSQDNLTTDTVNDLIAAVNIKITNNTCGAISVLVKDDTPLSIYNSTGFNLNASNYTIISGNNAKFICSSYGSGLMIDQNGQRPMASLSPSIRSGSLMISDNSCSFIHTGYSVPSGDTNATELNNNPSLIIKSNKLKAIDTSVSTGYLNTYYTDPQSATVNSGGSNSITATAIIVDGETTGENE